MSTNLVAEAREELQIYNQRESTLIDLINKTRELYQRSENLYNAVYAPEKLNSTLNANNPPEKNQETVKSIENSMHNETLVDFDIDNVDLDEILNENQEVVKSAYESMQESYGDVSSQIDDLDLDAILSEVGNDQDFGLGQ